MDWITTIENAIGFIPASNESKSCLHDLDDCREGRIPRPLGRFKSDAPLLAAGYLTEENVIEDLTVGSIAAKVNTSAFYFQRGFSMLCGYTVGKYIRMRRLSLAYEEVWIPVKERS